MNQSKTLILGSVGFAALALVLLLSYLKNSSHNEVHVGLYPALHGKSWKCQDNSRMIRILQICAGYPWYGVTPRPPHASQYSGVSKRFGIVLLDHKHKTMGCLISNAGATPWYDFVLRSRGEDVCNPHCPRRTDSARLRELQLEFLVFASYENIRANYSDYTKYIVVRHPLQRLMAGSYEAAVNKRSKADGAPLTFKELVEGLHSGELIDTNGHWVRYTEACNVCNFDYNYILKTETFEQDTEFYSQFAGIPDALSGADVLPNSDASQDEQNYMYDELLRDFQRENPDLMTHLLKLYAYDMKLFGYNWNSESGASSCSYDDEYGCC